MAAVANTAKRAEEAKKRENLRVRLVITYNPVVIFVNRPYPQTQDIK
jgi:hypothetical protein